MAVIKKQNSEPLGIKLEVMFPLEAWDSRFVSQTDRQTNRQTDTTVCYINQRTVTVLYLSIFLRSLLQ